MVLVIRKVTDTSYTGTDTKYELDISDADLENLNLQLYYYEG